MLIGRQVYQSFQTYCYGSLGLKVLSATEDEARPFYCHDGLYVFCSNGNGPLNAGVCNEVFIVECIQWNTILCIKAFYFLCLWCCMDAHPLFPVLSNVLLHDERFFGEF